jgi:hypothetical protein
MYPTAEPESPGFRPPGRRGGSTYYAATYQPNGAAPANESTSQQTSPSFPPFPEFPTPPPILPSTTAEPVPGVAGPPGFGPVGAVGATHTGSGVPGGAAAPGGLVAPGGYPALGGAGAHGVTGQGQVTAVAGPAAPPARRGLAGPILFGVVAAVLMLAAMGAAGLYFTRAGGDDTADPPAATGPAGAPASAGASTRPSAGPPAGDQAAGDQASGDKTAGGEGAITGDLSGFRTGDCLTVNDTDDHVAPARCTDADAYEVLLRRDGTTDEAVCQATDAVMSLYEDGPGTSRDLVLCVGPVD